MHIAYIGYGFSPQIPGGAGAIQNEILRWARLGGHRVSVIQAGDYDIFGKQKTTYEEVDGIQIARIWNSPSWPGVRDQYAQIYNPQIDTLLLNCLKRLRPDLVHIHELSFLSASIIEVIRSVGLPIIKTIHNYWDICPQRDLLYDGREICRNFESGRRCINCRALNTKSPLRMAVSRLARDVPRLPKIVKSSMRVLSISNERGRIPETDTSPQELANLAQIYSERRSTYVAALNSCNVVHCYSVGSATVLKGYGILEDKIRIIPIATAQTDSLTEKPDWNHTGRIRFVYRGGLAANKGVASLIQGFKYASPKNASLAIYGSGDRSYENELKSKAKNLAINFNGIYKQEELDEINRITDIGCVPSVGNEIFGLVGVEFLNGRIPVIASQAGGITDYVINEVNGLLFEPGNVQQIAGVISRLCENPKEIARLQSNIVRWHHSSYCRGQMLDLYREFAS